jgi:hypothetical protein
MNEISVFPVNVRKSRDALAFVTCDSLLSGISQRRSLCPSMARTMEQMEQLLGHALVRVEAVEKLHDRHEAETKSLMHEWRAEARVAAQLIQALQAQVVQLTSRVSTLVEALLAERRRNEQLSQERAERLRAQAEASENALREQFRTLSSRVEAQVDEGEKFESTLLSYGPRRTRRRGCSGRRLRACARRQPFRSPPPAQTRVVPRLLRSWASGWKH